MPVDKMKESTAIVRSNGIHHIWYITVVSIQLPPPPHLLFAVAPANPPPAPLPPVLCFDRCLCSVWCDRTSEDCNGNECLDGKKCKCDDDNMWTGPQCRAATAGDDYVYEVSETGTTPGGFFGGPADDVCFLVWGGGFERLETYRHLLLAFSRFFASAWLASGEATSYL